LLFGGGVKSGKIVPRGIHSADLRRSESGAIQSKLVLSPDVQGITVCNFWEGEQLPSLNSLNGLKKIEIVVIKNRVNLYD
jgi:hypothetical protein